MIILVHELTYAYNMHFTKNIHIFFEKKQHFWSVFQASIYVQKFKFNELLTYSIICIFFSRINFCISFFVYYSFLFE